MPHKLAHYGTLPNHPTIQPRLWKQRMGTINNNWDPRCVALSIYFWVSGGWSCWKDLESGSASKWSLPNLPLKIGQCWGTHLKNHQNLLGPPLSYYALLPYCVVLCRRFFFLATCRTHGSRGVFQCCAGLLAGTGRQRIAIDQSRSGRDFNLGDGKICRDVLFVASKCIKHVGGETCFLSFLNVICTHIHTHTFCGTITANPFGEACWCLKCHALIVQDLCLKHPWLKQPDLASASLPGVWEKFTGGENREDVPADPTQDNQHIPTSTQKKMAGLARNSVRYWPNRCWLGSHRSGYILYMRRHTVINH